MHKNPIKALVFDLDGTLANTLPLCIQAFRRAVEPLANRVLTDQEIIATFGPSEEGTIQALVPTHYQEGVASYITQYEQLHALCPTPFAGIPELLQHLRNEGIRLGLVTGKGPQSTAISLRYFKLSHYFDFIETGWIHGPRKVDGIRSILSQWPDINTGQVWYVGDAPSDILASRQAGISVVSAAWAETTNVEELRALQPDQLFISTDAFDQWVRSAVR
ncbi:HAD family hydrolase [Spirosoma sordidisoli]|uniref:phosphoglycolate phosphatase n=1 Tax=Spirosoma sordidisoli TaxID=2502893 RepID=A0A4Q2UJG1_9BACT|nr:HAD family hydrolase [Spirosoma sordidisoli]RYC67721.1 HAD family hydrolase [Spirosoma sordidisoli]